MEKGKLQLGFLLVFIVSIILYYFYFSLNNSSHEIGDNINTEVEFIEKDNLNIDDKNILTENTCSISSTGILEKEITDKYTGYYDVNYNKNGRALDYIGVYTFDDLGEKQPYYNENKIFNYHGFFSTFKNEKIIGNEDLYYKYKDFLVNVVNDTLEVNSAFSKYFDNNKDLFIDLYKKDLLKQGKAILLGDYKWTTIFSYSTKESSNIKVPENYSCLGGMGEITLFEGCLIFIEDKKGNLDLIKTYGEIDHYKGFILEKNELGYFKSYNPDGSIYNEIKMGYGLEFGHFLSYEILKLNIIFNRLGPNIGFTSLYFIYDDKLIRSEVFQESKLVVDLKENLIKNDFFVFNLEGKKRVFSTEIKGDYIEVKNIENLLMSLELGSEKSKYILSGTYSGKNERKGEKLISIKLKSIEVLSCKENNSTEYDTSWYKLKEFKQGDNVFKYNISEEYNNKCNIPYKIKLIYENGDVDIGEYSLKF